MYMPFVYSRSGSAQQTFHEQRLRAWLCGGQAWGRGYEYAAVSPTHVLLVEKIVLKRRKQLLGAISAWEAFEGHVLGNAEKG